MGDRTQPRITIGASLPGWDGFAALSLIDESLHEKGIQVAHQCWPPQVRMKRAATGPQHTVLLTSVQQGPQRREDLHNLLQQLFQAHASNNDMNVKVASTSGTWAHSWGSTDHLVS